MSQSQVTSCLSKGTSGIWRMNADWEFEQRLPMAPPAEQKNR
jgi:hypothetical protein